MQACQSSVEALTQKSVNEIEYHGSTVQLHAAATNSVIPVRVLPENLKITPSSTA